MFKPFYASHFWSSFKFSGMRTTVAFWVFCWFFSLRCILCFHLPLKGVIPLYSSHLAVYICFVGFFSQLLQVKAVTSLQECKSCGMCWNFGTASIDSRKCPALRYFVRIFSAYLNFAVLSLSLSLFLFLFFSLSVCLSLSLSL